MLAIFKNLQDSGQQAAIIGQFSIQHGQFQDVIDDCNVRVLSNSTHSLTNENKNLNRYTTEHGWDNVDAGCPVYPVTLSQDLVEILVAWARLPDSVKTGILAMVKVTSEECALSRW